jgi:asparagine synthase (glutamine-hydrolysing)
VRRTFLNLRERRQVRNGAELYVSPPWMQPKAAKELFGAVRYVMAREGLSYRRSIEQFVWPSRGRIAGMASLELLADDYEVAVRSPFASSQFLSAVVAGQGWRMYGSRTQAMRELVGDILPEREIGRRSKAWFDDAFFNRYSRAFARDWDGSGVDPDYIDVDALRTLWTDPAHPPDARTYYLLQMAWLHAERLKESRTHKRMTVPDP